MSGFLLPIKSAPVSNLRDQMSNAQLSYFGRLDSNTTANNSLITVYVDSGSAPSNNNYNLFVGDTLAIANATNGSTNYIVNGISGNNGIFLTSPIDNLNAFTGAYAIATRSAIHNISFSPNSSVQNGKWQVLIKATNRSGETANDGMPDQGGFDLGTLVAGDITCPWGATASVGTTVVLTSGVSVGSTGSYHLITCSLPVGGTNPVGTGSTSTITIGGTNKLINPAPAVNHTVGQANASADTYTIVIRHLDENSNLINNDTSIGKIALTESVLITATIDPTITFYVDSIGASTPGMTRCGTALSSNASQSTAASINFGSVSLGQFNTLAQRFTCSTNASNGYTVQIYENNQLINSSTGATIPDTDCDDGTCTTTSEQKWETDTGVTKSEFGYSLESITGPVAFQHDNVFKAKPFGVGTANAKVIMNRTDTPTGVDQGYICYRITASNFQEAGTYQNQINFIATATF